MGKNFAGGFNLWILVLLISKEVVSLLLKQGLIFFTLQTQCCQKGGRKQIIMKLYSSIYFKFTCSEKACSGSLILQYKAAPL